MVERDVSWQYPAIAAGVTVFVFAAIFASGMVLNDYKIDSLQKSVEQVEVEQNSHMVGQELSTNLEEDSCRAMGEWMNTTVDDLRELRKEVASYENANKIESARYETVKKRYMNLLLQNLAQVRQYDRNCDRQMIDIIYFYSDDCEACQDQGTILTHVRQEYDREIVVYPLDTELGMSPINFLQDYYGVDRYPSLVIDGELHSGFMPAEELEENISERLNRTETDDIRDLNSTVNNSVEGSE